MYTARAGAHAASDSKNSSLEPARGGSMSTTSTCSPPAAASRMKAPASPTTNRAFSTPLCRAFSRASRMADATESTPTTCAAPCLAATRPMVPVPQYASTARSVPEKRASSTACRYSTSVCTAFTW